MDTTKATTKANNHIKDGPKQQIQQQKPAGGYAPQFRLDLTEFGIEPNPGPGYTLGSIDEDIGPSRFRRGNWQKGLANSTDTVSSRNTPVYRPTTTPRPKTTLFTTFSRIFTPEIPISVVKSLETISLSATEDGWEFVELADVHFDNASIACDYVFSPEQKTQIMALMDLTRFYQPTIVTGETFSTADSANKAVLEQNRTFIESVKPNHLLSLSTVNFQAPLRWLDQMWTPDVLVTLRYDARARLWHGSLALEPGMYKLSITVQTQGSSPIVIDACNPKGVSLGTMTLETLAPVQDFGVNMYMAEQAIILGKVAETNRDHLTIIIKVSRGSGTTVLGRDTPMWTTDHRYVNTAAMPTNVKTERCAPEKDLTTEGIEPNPGPPFLVDHWRAMSKDNPEYYVMLALIDALSENKYGLLAEVDINSEEIIPFGDYQEPKDDGDSRGSRTAPKAKGGKTDVQHSGEEDKKKVRKQKEATPDNRKPPDPEQRQRVIDRIATKLATDFKYQAAFVSRLPSMNRKFIAHVSNVAWGLGWIRLEHLTVLQFIIYAHITNLTCSETISTVMDADPKITTPDGTHNQQKTNIDNSLLEIGNLAYIEASARMHNKQVHSLNGNIFVNTMTEVNQAPEFRSFMDNSPDSRSAVPSSTNNLVLANVATFNRQLRNPTDHSGFIADVQKKDGTIFENAAVPYIPSGLQQISGIVLEYNTRVRLALVRSEGRRDGMRIISLQMHDYYSNVLKASILSREIVGQVQSTGAYKTRSTEMTQAGYSFTDMVDISSFISITGLSLERPLLVLSILHSLIQHSDPRNIPPSCFINNSDTLKYGPLRDLTYTWNDTSAVVYPAECTSCTIFPFVGLPGRISFHVTLGTVPERDRSNAVFMPIGILGNGDTMTSAMAVWIMSIAQWPFCMSTYSVKDTPNTTEHWHPPAVSFWQPEFSDFCSTGFASWVLNHTATDIPGMMEMHIILARHGASKVPTSPQSARTHAAVIPTSGPTALSRANLTFPANTPLDVNYEGSTELKSYSLCDYLNSWLPTLSSSSLINIFSTISNLWGQDHEIRAAFYNMVSLIQRFPPMLIDQSGPTKEYQIRAPTIQAATHEVNNQVEPEPTDEYGEDVPHSSNNHPTQRMVDAQVSALSLSSGPTVSSNDDDDNQIEYCEIIHTEGAELGTIMCSKIQAVPCLGQMGGIRLPANPRINTVQWQSFTLNIPGWNKLVTGMAISDGFKSGSVLSIQPHLEDIMSIHTEVISAMEMAIAPQALITRFGLCGSCYSDTPRMVTYPRARQVIMSMFIKEATPMVFKPGTMVKHISNIYSNFMGFSQPKTPCNTTAELEQIDVFGRWYYTPLMQTFIDKRPKVMWPIFDPSAPEMIPSDLYMPSVLSEVWTHVLSSRTNKGFSSMPPPYGRDGPQGYDQNMSVVVMPDKVLTPYMDRPVMPPSFPTNHMVSQTDSSFWNSRLFYRGVLGKEQWRFYGGEIPEDNYVQGKLPSQIIINDDTYAPPLQDPVLYATTLSIPHFWVDGMRVYLAAKNTDANQMSRAQQGNARLSFTTWLVGNNTPNNPNIVAEEAGDDEYSAFLGNTASTVADVPIPANVASQMAVVAPTIAQDIEPITVEAIVNSLPA